MKQGFRRFAALLAFCAASPAAAVCPANNLYTFSWGNQTAVTLSYNGTYTYTATNPGGQSMNFTVSFAVNGTATPNSTVGGVSLPAINGGWTDGTVTNNLAIGAVFGGRTASITGTTNVIATTLTFPTTIRDLTFQINDIDFANNQYRDWIYISGTSAAGTYVPSIVTPWNTNNGAGAKTNGSSSLALGAATTPFNQTANEGVGTSASGNASTTGTLTASFVQPVTSTTLRYGNYPYQTGENTTGQQAFGIQKISFCPMPVLAMAKTSAAFSDPINGTTNPKMIPGGDVDYTITVTNSGGSPVDISTALVGDTLPAGVTFYNGDIDTVTAGTQNYIFNAGTSGLTLAAGDITYLNAGGTSITPAAGYDPLVRSVRWAPQGTMAANSSFSVVFRSRVN